nr:hypothetical protein [Tanacetum cinerariifolium]
MSDSRRSAPPKVSHSQCQASSPVSAVTTSKPSISRISCIKLRMSQSSSTTKTVDTTAMCSCWFDMDFGLGRCPRVPLTIRRRGHPSMPRSPGWLLRWPAAVVVQIDPRIPAQGKAGAGAHDGSVPVHRHALHGKGIRPAGKGQVLLGRGIAQVMLPTQGSGHIQLLSVVQLETATGACAKGGEHGVAGVVAPLERRGTPFFGEAVAIEVHVGQVSEGFQRQALQVETISGFGEYLGRLRIALDLLPVGQTAQLQVTLDVDAVPAMGRASGEAQRTFFMADLLGSSRYVGLVSGLRGAGEAVRVALQGQGDSRTAVGETAIQKSVVVQHRPKLALHAASGLQHAELSADQAVDLACGEAGAVFQRDGHGRTAHCSLPARDDAVAAGAHGIARRYRTATVGGEGRDPAVAAQYAGVVNGHRRGQRTIDRQAPLIDQGWAAVGVGTRQHQGTDTQLGQAAMPGYVIAPHVTPALWPAAEALGRFTGIDHRACARQVDDELAVTIGAADTKLGRNIRLGDEHARAVDGLAQVDH